MLEAIKSLMHTNIWLKINANHMYKILTCWWYENQKLTSCMKLIMSKHVMHVQCCFQKQKFYKSSNEWKQQREIQTS